MFGAASDVSVNQVSVIHGPTNPKEPVVNVTHVQIRTAAIEELVVTMAMEHRYALAVVNIMALSVRSMEKYWEWLSGHQLQLL